MKLISIFIILKEPGKFRNLPGKEGYNSAEKDHTMKQRLYLLSVIIFLTFFTSCSSQKETIRLMPLVERQMALGPRTPGSEAHAAFISDTVALLEEAGWQVRSEAEKYQGRTVRNIVADKGAEDSPRWIVLGAHFDCRIAADQEKQAGDQAKAVPGANDGASGVAVLLGLAQTLPEIPDTRVTLAFFDAEDQGRIMGWSDWCLGSRLLAEQYGALERKPDAVIIADMIGDKDLNVYRERNSDKTLTDQLFTLAGKLRLGKQFINEEKFTMYDDHVPFIEQGIPAADLIDFDYPWWHTLEDTADKLSEESLQAVYRLLYAYVTGELRIKN